MLREMDRRTFLSVTAAITAVLLAPSMRAPADSGKARLAEAVTEAGAHEEKAYRDWNELYLGTPSSPSAVFF